MTKITKENNIEIKNSDVMMGVQIRDISPQANQIIKSIVRLFVK